MFMHYVGFSLCSRGSR